MKHTAHALLLALAGAAPAAVAQQAPGQLFRGLTTVETSVIGVTPAMEAEGLRVRDIHDDIDRRLRGTRLLLRRGLGQAPAGTALANPLLQVTPNCRSGSSGRQVCHVSVELREAVALVRDPAVRLVGTVWHSSWLGEINRFSELRARIESMVDQFANDYSTLR